MARCRVPDHALRARAPVAQARRRPAAYPARPCRPIPDRRPAMRQAMHVASRPAPPSAPRLCPQADPTPSPSSAPAPNPRSALHTGQSSAPPPGPRADPPSPLSPAARISPQIQTSHPPKPAHIGHAPHLLAILWAFTRHTPWLPLVRSRLTDLRMMLQVIRRGWVHVAFDAQGPAGFIARDGQCIHALYIHPRARGTGLGRTLLDQAKCDQPRLIL